MKTKTGWKKHLPLIFVGGLVPTVIVLSIFYDFPQTVTILLLIVLGLIFGSMALWSYANRDADGSEWWQDNDASGWRGY
jgi:ABC-type transport system involved in cytochrome bd biosynthesis fused ATPase/permease subunit